MSIQEVETFEKDNVVKFELLTGGKQPPKQGGNWLNKLNMWAHFVARNANISKVDLFHFQINAKYTNSTALVFFIPKEEPTLRFVSTVDFSDDYELMDVLDYGDPGNRADLIRGLETDANIEQDNTMAGETGQSEI